MSFDDYQQLRNLVQGDPDLKDKMDWTGKTMWQQLKPEQRKLFHRLKTHIKCFRCGKDVIGALLLTRERLKLQDTEGFVLLEEGPYCDNCSGDQLNRK
jgi:hypothetical protein